MSGRSGGVWPAMGVMEWREMAGYGEIGDLKIHALDRRFYISWLALSPLSQSSSSSLFFLSSIDNLFFFSFFLFLLSTMSDDESHQHNFEQVRSPANMNIFRFGISSRKPFQTGQRRCLAHLPHAMLGPP